MRYDVVLGQRVEATMIRTPNNGAAQPVTTSDFNERIKRIFERKIDPNGEISRPAPPARKPRVFKSSCIDPDGGVSLVWKN